MVRSANSQDNLTLKLMLDEWGVCLREGNSTYPSFLADVVPQHPNSQNPEGDCMAVLLAAWPDTLLASTPAAAVGGEGCCSVHTFLLCSVLAAVTVLEQM